MAGSNKYNILIQHSNKTKTEEDQNRYNSMGNTETGNSLVNEWLYHSELKKKKKYVNTYAHILQYIS